MRLFVVVWLACAACGVAPPDVDADRDGVTVGDGDCDDADADVGPHRDEVPYDGVDGDCDPATPDDDLDGDGWRKLGGDCDDDPATGAEVYPGRDEVPYDGIDQDCDGVDLVDVDGDGYDGGTAGDDCDDRDPRAHPAGVDICGNGSDEDCTGADAACTPVDADGDGIASIDGDCNDEVAAIHPGATEIPYDGVDQDCDTDTPDDDLDGDGWRKLGGDCDDDPTTGPAVHPGRDEVPYDGIDQDCDGVDLVDVDGDGAAGGDDGTDCDDRDPGARPGAVEVYHDGVDQDCDPATDDADADGDGHDAPRFGGDDCDDFDAATHPGADETPYDGVDGDCDPTTPDDDLDQDGFAQVGDCDDDDATRRPGAPEIAYDDIDQDCDGVDLVDVDGDGFAGGPSGPDCADFDPDRNPDATEVPYDGADQDCDGADHSPSIALPQAACGPVEAHYLSSAEGVTLVVGVCRSEEAWDDTLVGLLVDDDGTSGDWFEILGPARVMAPRATWDGANFVVLGLLEQSGAPAVATAALVSPQGDVGAPVALDTPEDVAWWEAPKMVSRDGKTLVLLDGGSTPAELVLLDADLAPIATPSLPVGYTYALAASAHEFLVVVGGSDLRAMTLDRLGAVAHPLADLGPPRDQVSNVAAVSDGREFAVVASTSTSGSPSYTYYFDGYRIPRTGPFPVTSNVLGQGTQDDTRPFTPIRANGRYVALRFEYPADGPRVTATTLSARYSGVYVAGPWDTVWWGPPPVLGDPEDPAWLLVGDRLAPLRLVPPDLPGSCRALLDADPTTSTGVHWLAPEGGAPLQAWCDMTTDDGGWTLVAHLGPIATTKGALFPDEPHVPLFDDFGVYDAHAVFSDVTFSQVGRFPALWADDSEILAYRTAFPGNAMLWPVTDVDEWARGRLPPIPWLALSRAGEDFTVRSTGVVVYNPSGLPQGTGYSWNTAANDSCVSCGRSFETGLNHLSLLSWETGDSEGDGTANQWFRGAPLSMADATSTDNAAAGFLFFVREAP